MAVWGVPSAIEDAEAKAVKAGLAMLEEMSKWNEELQKSGSPAIGIGIGISSGRVIAGSLGSSDHMEYTVIGDVVNTAQRAESIAQKQQLLITETTYQVLKEQITALDIGEVQLKGKDHRVQFWSVTGFKFAGKAAA
jgi:adenylate cyclase